MSKQFEELLYQATLEAVQAMGDDLTGMSCFVGNWQTPAETEDLLFAA